MDAYKGSRGDIYQEGVSEMSIIFINRTVYLSGFLIILLVVIH